VTGTDAVRIVFELDPTLATSITSRAVFTLVTEGVTGVVLIIVAAVFWRYSRRVEADARHVEHDRHLRMLGEMSALLGHELRNPLASLKGHAQLLVERLPDGHPGRRGAATIVREAVRLEDLATEVLDFVRTGALDIADVDPVQVAQSALEASGGDGVAIEAAGDLPRWPMDGARIQQVLVNLLKNARDASTAEIDISLVVAVAAGSLLYEVRDRGVGLQPGDEERAFQPFFTRRASGTGLGLPLARRIVEGHGGTIQAEKREGGGAVFRITLPRVPASRGTDAALEGR
jgi:two-component system sensor histidine kinase HydH